MPHDPESPCIEQGEQRGPHHGFARQGVSPALWAVFAGLALVALAGLVQSILLTALYDQLRDASDEDFDTLINRLRLCYQVFPLCSALGYGLLAYAFVRLGAVPVTTSAGHSVRILAWMGCAMFALVGVDEVLLAVSNVGEGQSALIELMSHKVTVLARTSVSAAGLVCLWLLFTLLASAMARPLPRGLVALGWLWVAWDVGFLLYRVLAEPAFEMRETAPWRFFAITRGLWFAGLALFAFIALRLARGAAKSGGHAHAPGQGLGSTQWSPVSDGLQLYSSALTWRLVLTVLGYSFLILAVLTRSVGMAKLIVFSMPLVALVASVAMIVGLARYARQPLDSPAATAGWISMVLTSFAFVLEVYSFFLLLRLLGPENTPTYELRETAESVQSMSVWAMGLGFAALVTLLISFGQLARHLQRHDLVDRVVGVGVFLAIIACVVLGFRSHVSSGVGANGGTMLPIAVVVLVVALTAVAAYLKLVNSLVQAIRDSCSMDELPTARVL